MLVNQCRMHPGRWRRNGNTALAMGCEQRDRIVLGIVLLAIGLAGHLLLANEKVAARSTIVIISLVFFCSLLFREL